MLDITPEIGKRAESIDGEATREGGYIHCPECGEPAVYFESFTDTQVCTDCGKEFTQTQVMKFVVTVKR